jgi:hypothetical protein
VDNWRTIKDQIETIEKDSKIDLIGFSLFNLEIPEVI